MSSGKFVAELQGAGWGILPRKYLDKVMVLSYIPTALFKKI